MRVVFAAGVDPTCGDAAGSAHVTLEARYGSDASGAPALLAAKIVYVRPLDEHAQ
jgi:hypothetical protein